MKKNMLFLVVLSLFLTSCALLKKKDPNNLVGAGAGDISSKDIDSDNTGSDGGGLDGLSTIYFAYDSSVLSQKARQTLAENLSWMQNHSEVKSLTLEGHCDSMGLEAYNIGLGRRRAEAVRQFLLSQGLSDSQVSIVSYGEERPLSDWDHAKNRRVNFVPVY